MAIELPKFHRDEQRELEERNKQEILKHQEGAGELADFHMQEGLKRDNRTHPGTIIPESVELAGITPGVPTEKVAEKPLISSVDELNMRLEKGLDGVSNDEMSDLMDMVGEITDPSK